MTFEERQTLRRLVSEARYERVRMRLEREGAGLCERCGNEFVRMARGRQKRYCSVLCRKYACLERKEAA